MSQVVKYGMDPELEALANKLLAQGVGANARSADRDLEKAAYEQGFIAKEHLQHYDPTNDWDTQEEPSAVLLVEPSGMGDVSPTICAEVDDGNVRARNPELAKRRALQRRLGDEASWGENLESIPLLGVNEGPRKTCSKCKKSKGLGAFSAHPHTRDKKQSQCRSCKSR